MVRFYVPRHAAAGLAKIPILLIAVSALVGVLDSCQPRQFLFDEWHPPVAVHQSRDGLLYAAGNADSGKLIVYLDGGGPRSVLGSLESAGGFTAPSAYWGFLYVLGDDWQVVAPEKLSAEPGEAYQFDEEFLRHYGARNLIAQYARLIDRYLSENRVANAVIVGQSEGALVLPGVYQAMQEQARVAALVSFSGGGMSPYEYAQLGTDAGPAGLRDVWWERVDADPDSIEQTYQGLPFRWWSSWQSYSPLDAYRGVDIPVLFVHGTEDSRVPAASTRLVESALPDKPFEYWYLEGEGHGSRSAEELVELLSDVDDWLSRL